ncbi:hypothetical protein ORG27_12180 [Stenotrophomonas lactitubi]|uniref:hypothetical protein n=1 Tax=Stenotrophomonas lactitubi TaxID=2045214 RepID=UPI002248984A|nr:hypothetical protein [Stenotrophomonas lactitubi]MCX2894334.1 hypothetical protein [Stenotrophomonas lactitubi]
MRAQLIGFAPDLDPETPGILTDCNAIIPTTFGLAAANSLVSANYPALASPANSAFIAQLLDGTKRVLVADGPRIEEASGGAWVDRSRAGGYSGTSRMRWAVFGNNVLACNRTEVIGQAVPGSSFTDIAGSPAASIIVTAAGFVMALNVSQAQYGDAPDGWHCSGIRNQATWTAAAATQCAFGRLLDSPGAIKAGAALGSDIVAYKDTSMYLGRYVGPPLVWQWDRVPGDIGCSGNESVVVVGTQQFFIGPSDFYVYDGTVPRPIGGATFNSPATPVREWFFANLNQQFKERIFGVADIPRDLVYWYYPSVASSGQLDACIIYNYRTNQWGKQAIGVEAALLYSSGQITYDGLGALYATYDDLPNIAYDSSFWLADSMAPAVIQGGVLKTITGEPGPSWLMTGDIGDMDSYVFANRFKPRFRTLPATAQMTNFYREDLGASRIQGVTAQMQRNRFDFRQSSHWHSFRLDFPGRMAINGFSLAINGETAE